MNICQYSLLRRRKEDQGLQENRKQINQIPIQAKRILISIYNNSGHDIIYNKLYILQVMSKPQPAITLDRTLKWLDKTEGRDKFCKAIQYACRYLKYHYNKKGDKVMQKKVDALFCAMRDARKLFRLFKTFKEYGKLLQVLGKKNSMKTQDFVLESITRIFFGLYWFFDNISILSKLGIIGLDAKQMGKRGSTCWFIALVSTFIRSLKTILVNTSKISQLRKSAMTSGTGETNEKISQALELKKSNSKQLFTLIKTIGDMLPAGQGCQFYQKAFGFNVNQGWCGIGGLVSAILTSYQLYQ